MARTTAVCLAILLAVGIAFAADSPFAGTWKLNPAKSEFTGTTVKLEQGPAGEMKMTAEGQSYTFRIDGKAYPTPWGATAAWTQVNPGSWEAVYRMADKGTHLGTDTLALSADGKTLTLTSRGTTPSGEKFENATVYARAAGTAGLVGTWRSTKVQFNSPEVMQIADSEGDGLKWTLPAYVATVDVNFDGKDYVLSGPTVPPGFTLAMRRIDARSFELTNKLGGKIVYRGTYALSADGKTLTVTSMAEGTQEKVKAVYDRQ